MLVLLKDKHGEGYIDSVVILLVVMILIGLSLKVLPVFITKGDLNSFAQELMRTAEIEGEIGLKTQLKAQELADTLGLSPKIEWSKTGKMQLNSEFSLTLTTEVDIGFFKFASFPIILSTKVLGRSEVYQK